MLQTDLQLLSTNLLKQYNQVVSDEALSIGFNQLEDAPLSTDNFSFHHAVASVYSSKIEGEAIELDSYIKHKRFHIEFQPDYTRKIDDLYLAYQFASENRPNSETFAEMDKLYADLEVLLNAELTISETFFFASMIHLVFVKIHPWNDGNGRSARLFEKWFLAQKLGNKAWFVQSEKYYYTQHETYYNNIRALGLEYQDLEYSKALPFLLMLPKSVTYKE